VAFYTFCDNKGCRKQMAPVIDKETQEVFCTECGKPINCVTDFMKRQMISLGQVKRAEKRQMAWSVACNSCKKEGPPALDKEGKELVCSYCGASMSHLNKPFAHMVKQNLLAQRRIGNQ
jgi:DNA-directed RNA polymerase subunit RPC12/RpoP